MVDTSKEQRRHIRIDFPKKAILRFNQQEESVQLLDISLKGGLVDKPKGWSAALHDTCVMVLELSPEINIEMSMSVAHITGNHLGLKCDYIDVESITHLRRLVALNVSDESVLERELIELTAHNKH